MYNAQRILVLSPHTDDAELGCGGSIARFVEQGSEVHIAAFSTAEESLPDHLPPDQLRIEFCAAARSLALPESNIHVFNYPVRRLSTYRQEVLDEIVKLKKKLQPELVLVPSSSDVHQDHQVIFNESLRAFKDSSMWGYELPWNHVSFSANAFVSLEERHLVKKWGALREYKSQIELNRPYFTQEFIFGLAGVRGVQIKTKYAEAFEVVRVKF